MKHSLLSFFAVCLLAAMPAQAALYICGGFNGWNAAGASAFTQQPDGVYAITIDFSQSREFKMSTVLGNWSEFDTGTFECTATQVVADQWLAIAHKVQSGNMQAPASQIYKVLVDLDNLQMKFESSTTPATAWSGTLPVMFINTAGGVAITSKDEYTRADFYLDPMGVDGVEAIGSKEAPDSLQIKGRGNYTWSGFDKKPYGIKLFVKQKMLGMPKGKKWALLAHADDNFGFMRNFTGFALSRMLGMPWTPGSEPVELVLNGQYMGLYFLTETVGIDKNRVNIVEQADEATTDVDGGWLVEIDNYDTDPHVTVDEGGDNDNYPIWFTYKSPEVLSTQQHDYLLNAMTAVNNAIYNTAEHNSDNPALASLLDLDVAARYYMANEIVDDCESYHGSCYLNRDRGADCKWMFGPCWDFGNAFNRGASQQFIFSNPTWHQVWIGGIYQFKAFQTAVKRLWADFLVSGPADIDAAMGAFADRIAAAASADARRWPQYGNANELSAAAEARRLVAAKIQWLKTQWGADGIDAIAADSPAATVKYYNLQGQPVAQPTQGLYIKVTGNQAQKVYVN